MKQSSKLLSKFLLIASLLSFNIQVPLNNSDNADATYEISINTDSLVEEQVKRKCKQLYKTF